MLRSWDSREQVMATCTVSPEHVPKIPRHRIVRALARLTAAPKSAAMPVGRPHAGPTKVTEQCNKRGAPSTRCWSLDPNLIYMYIYIYIHIIYIYIYHIYHISYIPNDIWNPMIESRSREIARGFLFAMPWKSKDLHLNEIDWAMPRLAPGSRLTVQEVWVESDFTKPPDYLPLGKMQKWGWEMLMFLDLRFMFFWCLLVEECGDVFFTCLEIDIIGNWEKRATVEWEYWYNDITIYITEITITSITNNWWFWEGARRWFLRRSLGKKVSWWHWWTNMALALMHLFHNTWRLGDVFGETADVFGFQRVPSGKLSHNELENHHAING